MWLVVVIVFGVAAIAGLIGSAVGYSIGLIDGKYQERKDLMVWACANGHNDVTWRLVHQSLRDAL